MLYFLPIFLILYGITPARHRNTTLLIGSLVFYACGDVKYLPILGCSILVNYTVGLNLSPPRRKNGEKTEKRQKKEKLNRQRKILLAVAVTGNVSVLVLFKILSQNGQLPLGISFYTFQAISYLIDVYRGKVPKEQSCQRFSVYISMFPQLGAGPIVCYEEVRQNLKQRNFCPAGVQDGLKLFIMGLASKVLLADRIGLLWQQVQTVGVESISCAYAWMGALAFSMKIYFDFYGYSLMAKGLGRILGFELPENFNHPYMAVSVRDFYRRWHMTLSRWFCRYVYIPLGGSREGEWRTVCNLFLVWLLTSLWHGFSWNFLLWGGLLWACIVLERQLERLGITKKWKMLSHLWVWIFIPVTWMCFAITDFNQLGIYLGRMFGVVEGINVRANDWIIALGDYWYLLAAAFLACTPLVQKLYRKGKDTVWGMVILAALFWVCVWRIDIEGNNPFMYLGF
ncbi:MAG: hypothetical protein NC094_10560 [Bacteroidales bacterium]|nr:MBOAT family protein [Lachnoclostridium sp.]MCM1384961.1 MBOAT family protein [Lachnoclostridium sp.]MCM1465849.1 hypothetical protein [Bacteroidales bacterium]